MRDRLLDIMLHRSVVTMPIVILAIMTLAFAPGGMSLIEISIMAGTIVVWSAIWLLAKPSPTKEIDSLQAFRTSLKNGSRSTLIQLYSSYCVACVALKPAVDQLEAEAGERLQIIRLDIDQEPGKAIMKEYGVLFTPTFLHFDKNGIKVRESALVLDRPRIMYDLERA